MDMLPKLQFVIQRPYSSIPQIMDVKFSDDKIIYSGITVKEFVKVYIRFTCPNDPNATLFIETYNSEEVQELQPSDNDVLIMSGENAEHMLVPGNHRIEVSCLGKQYHSYFTIESTHFFGDALLNLRTYVENMLNGLSYDIVKQKFGMATLTNDINITLMQLFQFLYKHKNQILTNLDLISKDPLDNLIGEYQVTTISKKPDNKSIRWQAKKGGLKNGSALKPRLFYEKHAELTTKNIENQWIRYIIKFFLTSLRKLDISFQKEASHLQTKIDNQERQQEINRQQKELATAKRYGFEMQITKLHENERRYTEHIKKLKKEQGVYLAQKQFIRQLTYFFSQKESLPWVQYLPTTKPNKVTKRLLKDSRYRRIFTLYKELLKLENNDVNSRLPGIAFKKTWQLFEYYNLGLVIEILKENGYKWVRGWLADKDNPHMHIGTLSSDTILIFEHPSDDHYIEVAYDAEVESSINDKTYSRYFNQTGRRPDIRLTIYKKSDNSLYSNQAGLIIECKCRRHQYLINDLIDPDIKLQLRDFKHFEYFVANSTTHVVTPISKVIVLYPRQNGADSVVRDRIYGESMVFIQIEPCNPENESKPFGYYNLKERVDYFLSQVKESEDILK